MKKLIFIPAICKFTTVVEERETFYIAEYNKRGFKTMDYPKDSVTLISLN